MNNVPSAAPPPWGAVIASSWLPGAGQILAGRVRAGVLWLVSLLAGAVLLFWTMSSAAIPGVRVSIGVGVSLAMAWLAMLAHAYRVCPQPALKGTTWPWVAAWLSWVLPGLGQLLQRRWLAGVAFLIATTGGMFLPDRWALLVALPLSAASAYLLLRRQPAHRTLLAIFGLRVLGSLILALGVRTFLLEPFTMPSASMAPTIMPGDRLFTDKLVYRLRPPHRGELVVFRTDSIAAIPAATRGSIFIKRVVGLPGERVSIRPPHVLINGDPVDINGLEYVLPEPFPRATFLASETNSILLGRDEYLVLGDNTYRSLDGRFWGPMQRHAIIGRATKVYWPAARAGIALSR